MSDTNYVYTVEGGDLIHGISVLGVYDWSQHAEDSIRGHLKTHQDRFGNLGAVMLERTIYAENRWSWADRKVGIFFNITRWPVQTA